MEGGSPWYILGPQLVPSSPLSSTFLVLGVEKLGRIQNHCQANCRVRSNTLKEREKPERRKVAQR